jgi:hypothetical protein
VKNISKQLWDNLSDKFYVHASKQVNNRVDYIVWNRICTIVCEQVHEQVCYEIDFQLEENLKV